MRGSFASSAICTGLLLMMEILVTSFILIMASRAAEPSQAGRAGEYEMSSCSELALFAWLVAAVIRPCDDPRIFLTRNIFRFGGRWAIDI